jgi:uncharacterized protein (DUF58 family)
LTTGLRPDQLDPATLASLGHLEVVARWIVDGFLTGLHRSARKGFSVEFAEHRPYQPGDDPRFVDWRIAARSDRWVVKEYEEETNLRAALVVDASASMDWRGAPTRLTKLAWANRAAAAASLFLLRQRDAVGLVRFSDTVDATLPASARMAHWPRVLSQLHDVGRGQGTAVAQALASAGQMIRRPGLVLLCSDLLADAAPVVDAVRTLRAVGHAVLVLQVLDPVETDLALAGDLLLEDPESGETVPARPTELREAYRATYAEAQAEWRQALTALGVAFVTATTDQPFGPALRAVLHTRERLP